MKKKTIRFETQEKFEDSLNSYKLELLADYDYEDLSMYFHIFSTELQEEAVRPIWESIEKIFPGKPWFGHSTAGNVFDCEITADLSVSVTVFEKATTKFRLFQYNMESHATEEIAADIIKECEKNKWVKAVEFYRTINPESPSVFCDKFDVLPEDIQMFGSIVCSRDITGTESCVFSSVGGFDPKGLVVLLFGGEEFFVNSYKVSGWQPIGHSFVVTKAEGCTIYELDGVPAFNVYKKYLNIENDENLFVNALEFPMMYENNGVTVVRATASGNKDGSLVMSADIKQGSIVRLSYGEPNTIMRAVQNEAKQIHNFHPDLLHIFYCTARKVFWGMDEPITEIYPFHNVKGSMGFFSHGEFLREKGNLNQHSMTLVLAAMREGEGTLDGEMNFFDESSIMTKLPLATRMATFIRQTSLELEAMNRQLQYYNEQLQDIVRTDTLTGLENRLAFDSLLKDIENDTGKDWVMLMIDLNGLKEINDTFGHEAGDTMIKDAANVLKEVYGECGRCFRIGGDEFVVIIDAREDRISECEKMLKEKIAIYNSTVIHQLSMAIGVSRLYKEDGSRMAVNAWMKQADQEMYRDKELFYKSRKH